MISDDEGQKPKEWSFKSDKNNLNTENFITCEYIFF